MSATVNLATIALESRCPDCGRRSFIAGACAVCGNQISARDRNNLEAIIEKSPIKECFLVQQDSRELELNNPFKPMRPMEPSSKSVTRIGFISSEIRGRVIVVRQAANEPMDFDLWRWLAIPLWGLVLLSSPLVLGIIVWKSSGFLYALGVLVCSVFLLQFIFSDRLIHCWRLAASLNGRQIVESMPVTMLRIRVKDGSEVQLRMKGVMNGGNVMEGDRIAATGSWYSGVFAVRRLSCERTGAAIVPCQPNARILAIAGFCLLVGGVLWMWQDGIPWARSEVIAFRSSLLEQYQYFQLRKGNQ